MARRKFLVKSMVLFTILLTALPRLRIFNYIGINIILGTDYNAPLGALRFDARYQKIKFSDDNPMALNSERKSSDDRCRVLPRSKIDETVQKLKQRTHLVIKFRLVFGEICYQTLTDMH